MKSVSLLASGAIQRSVAPDAAAVEHELISTDRELRADIAEVTSEEHLPC